MSEHGKSSKQIPWLWIGLALALIAITVAWILLPVDEWMKSFNMWIKGLGAWGVIIFALAYIIGTIILAPGAAFSIAAGLAYSGWGFPLVIVAATIGASLAFLVGRHAARDRVRKMVDDRPRFAAVDKAVSEDGWKVVVLLRLSPVIPFNLQNYFFGVTDIKFWHYVGSTFVGIMPGAALYVYLGAIGSAAGGEGGGALKWVFFAVGLIATILVVILVTRKARSKLKDYGVEDKSDTTEKSDLRKLDEILAATYQPDQRSSLIVQKSAMKLLLFLLLSLLLNSCAIFTKTDESGTQRASQQTEADKNRILSQGYAQLYEAASSLHYLDELLLLKFESDAVDEFAEDTAGYFSRLKGELEKLDSDYPSLSLDDNGLPLLEKKKRSAAQDDRIKSLAPVTGRTGVDFERTLLLTLSGTFNQLRFLARVMQEEEKDQQRIAFLKDVERNFNRLYDQDVNLLNDEYFCHSSNDQQ